MLLSVIILQSYTVRNACHFEAVDHMVIITRAFPAEQMLCTRT